MIQSFKDSGTSDIFYGKNTKIATRKLDQLDSVNTLEDLSIPYGNQLKALSGDRNGQFSIRINGQYRVRFIWVEVEPDEVEIVDYH